jgi:hypothetical protein
MVEQPVKPSLGPDGHSILADTGKPNMPLAFAFCLHTDFIMVANLDCVHSQVHVAYKTDGLTAVPSQPHLFILSFLRDVLHRDAKRAAPGIQKP